MESHLYELTIILITTRTTLMRNYRALLLKKKDRLVSLWTSIDFGALDVKVFFAG